MEQKCVFFYIHIDEREKRRRKNNKKLSVDWMTFQLIKITEEQLESSENIKYPKKMLTTKATYLLWI